MPSALKMAKTPSVLMPASFTLAATLPQISGSQCDAVLQLGSGGCIFFNGLNGNSGPSFPAIDAWPIPAPANNIALYQGRWATGVQFSSGAAGRDLNPWFEWRGVITSGTINQGAALLNNTWRSFSTGGFGDQFGTSRASGSGVGTTSGVVTIDIRSKGAAIILSTFGITFSATRT